MPRAHRTVVSLTGLAAVVGGLVGCSSDPVALGAAGVTMAPSGDPVVMVAVCTGHVDAVTVWDSTAGGSARANQVWHAIRHLDGTVRLDLGHPGADWSRQRPARLRPAHTYVALPVQSGVDAEAAQVSFRARDLEQIRPGSVYVNPTPESSRLVRASSVSGFRDHICARGAGAR
ncbi:hypothetical protein [Nocardioides terrisoli]|uniref:hypothetical protein n=1 Tax=Nocardioides terrisoli TaxID=3388267 RepID=UPI00287BC4EC|nr:hypothetical protein [Nocardioides marmorisolisilvae]